MLFLKLFEEIEKAQKLPLAQAAVAVTPNNKIAKFNIGYYNAIGLNPIYKEAIRTFEKFAKENDPDALHNLGVMYLNGYGVEPNKNEANKWFEKAFEHGIE